MRLTSPSPAVPTADAALRPRLPAGRGLAAPLALLTALCGGLALAAAFPPAGIWPLAAAGPALLVMALWRQRLRTVIAAGALFGLAFFSLLLPWLINLAWYAWAALADRRDRHLHRAGRRASGCCYGCGPGRWRSRAGGCWPRGSGTGGRSRGFPGAGW